MRQFFVTISVILAFSYSLFSQTATLRGTVKDGSNGELLEGATVLQPPANGTTTNISGDYELKVEPGEITLIISY